MQGSGAADQEGEGREDEEMRALHQAECLGQERKNEIVDWKEKRSHSIA